MKRKEIIVTIVICALLILGGTIGVSICYRMFFQPENIIEADQPEESDWQSQKKIYETKVLYPIEVWKEDGTLEQLSGFQEISYYYGGDGKTYTLMKKLAELLDLDSKMLYDAQTIVYTFQTETKEYKEYGLSYVFQVELGENGEELIFIMDEDNIPVSCQYYKKKQSTSSIEKISIQKEAVPVEIQLIFEQMDEIYGQVERYDELRGSVADAISLGEGISLSVGLSYAKWQVYRDEAMAVYVAIGDEYNMLFYYDRINNQFCGFNIGMNAKK